MILRAAAGISAQGVERAGNMSKKSYVIIIATLFAIALGAYLWHLFGQS
jgi:hypothetical protein